MVTQNHDDIPFDIGHRRYLFYEPQKSNSYRAALEKTVRAVLTQGT